MRGRVNARDRTFVLVPAEWIDRPAGHTAVGLSGTLHDNGLTIEGDLRGCTAIGSRRFTAQRGSAGAPPATAGGLADEPLVPPTGGRFEGRWKGVVQCARPPELPLALTVLEDSGALAAVVTVGWPSGSGKSLKYSDQQMVLAGQTTAAAGASLQRSIMFTRALLAMECLTILGAGAGEQMRVRITRFEKIGCAAPAALTGFLCDYAVGIQSSSPAMQGRLGELMGGGQAARARFVHTTEGWLFRRLE